MTFFEIKMKSCWYNIHWIILWYLITEFSDLRIITSIWKLPPRKRPGKGTKILAIQDSKCLRCIFLPERTWRKSPRWWSPFIPQHPLHLSHLCNSVGFYCIDLTRACCSCYYIFLTLSAFFLKSYSILLPETNSEIWIYRVICI